MGGSVGYSCQKQMLHYEKLASNGSEYDMSEVETLQG